MAGMADNGARIIDGNVVAARLRERICAAVAELDRQHDLTPGLAVVLVGDDPASEIYVRNKNRQTTAVGMNSFEHRLPGDTSERALLNLIRGLNGDRRVHGILVQLPLPKGIEPRVVIDAVDPAKDVDGFHAVNAGRLFTGDAARALVPCTPQGCLLLIKETLGADLAGLEAVVLGRSNIVGKPMAQLLLDESCTVTIAHSKSRDLAATCRRADVLVAAVGKPNMVQGAWIKPGATVIDVGINRVAAADGKPGLAGDVDFATARLVAGAITPVPGGVGPMTIACLLRNTVIAACRQRDIDIPDL